MRPFVAGDSGRMARKEGAEGAGAGNDTLGFRVRRYGRMASVSFSFLLSLCSYI